MLILSSTLHIIIVDGEFSREEEGACDGTIIDGRSASLEKQKEKKALNYPWSAAGRENMDYEGIWKKVLRELRLYQL
jgi:hypothetical protein